MLSSAWIWRRQRRRRDVQLGRGALEARRPGRARERAQRRGRRQVEGHRGPRRELRGVVRVGHQRSESRSRPRSSASERAADVLGAQQTQQRVDARGRLAVEREHPVADAQARARGRTSLGEREHLDGGGLRQPEVRARRRSSGRVRPARPSRARRTRPCWQELAHHPVRRGGRHREADALRVGDDRRVDADARCRAESSSGPPELPGLSGAVCWMTLSIRRPSRAAQRAAGGAHDAGGDARLEAERVADRDGELTRVDGAQSRGARTAARRPRRAGARGRWPDRGRRAAPAARARRGAHAQIARALPTTWSFVIA